MKNGIAEYDRLLAETGETAQPYMTVETPSGGLHHYFKGTMPTSAGKIAPGIDIRGVGGYVLLPGSTIDGRAYSIISERDAADSHTPQRLLDLIRRSSSVTPRQAPADFELDQPENVARYITHLRNLQPVHEGGGSDAACYAAACQGHDFGLSEEAVCNVMMDEFQMWPKDRDYIEQKVANAFRYAENEPGCDAALTPSKQYGDLGPALIPAPAERKSLFTFWDEDQQDDLPEMEWAVEKKFPRRGTAIIGGEYGAGKTGAGMEAALCIASGHDFYGSKVNFPGPVIYCAGEGARGVAKERRQAWRSARGVTTKLPFYVSPRVPQVSAAEQHALIREIREAGIQPVAIFVDTLTRAMAGLNENDAGDALRLTNACDELSEAFNCLVVSVHHFNKGGGMRGSTGFPANTDSVHAIERNGNRVTLKCIKQKDGQEYENIHLKFRSVQDSFVLDLATGADAEGPQYVGRGAPALCTFGNIHSVLRGLGDAVSTKVLAQELLKVCDPSSAIPQMKTVKNVLNTGARRQFADFTENLGTDESPRWYWSLKKVTNHES